MPATVAALGLERRLRRQLANVLDAQTRDLVRAWAIAWDEIAPELRDTLAELLADSAEGTVSRRTLDRSQRLRAALAVIADTLSDLAPAAGVRINTDLKAVVDQAARAQADIVAAQLPAEQDLVDVDKRWTKRDLDPLQAIVRRSSEQITALHEPLSDEAYDAVRRELVRAVAVGQNPRATAQRMVRRAEGEFNGGLTRALNIARTEVVDAHRAAAKVGQDRHTDVLAGWIWLATLTPRTCRACLGMHGREFPPEEPGPHGHQQCRCSRMPKVKTWAELGFDVEEPPSAVQDADEFFDRLTPDQQRKLLGRKGYDAWVAGEFPREEWAKLRESPGWRDSMVPAQPGDTAGGDGPPGDPPATALAAADEPLIGPVLGTPDQQTYYRHPDDVMPEEHPVNVWEDANADNAFTFVPDPDDRAAAILQYELTTARLAKDLAATIDAGAEPSSDWERAAKLFFLNRMRGLERFGVEDDNYAYEDLVTDLTYTANRLLDRLERPEQFGTLFRGMAIAGVYDLADADQQLAAAMRVLPGMWFVSASAAMDLALRYTGQGQGTTPVLLVIEDAAGVRLDSVGRMSTYPEFLLTGLARPVRYWVADGVLHLLVRFEL